MSNYRLNSDIIKYKEIDSTNNEAVRLLDKKKSFPYWILAEKQTAGKGRKNRYWDSLIGNFMGTYVIEINIERKFLPNLAFVTALAIYDTILKFISSSNGKMVQLKWPNDLILNKSISSKNENNHIIAIGIGVNLIKSPLKTTFPSCNIFEETNIKIDPEEFLFELDKNIIKRINFWNNGLNYEAILEQWIEKAFLLNKKISVTLPNGKKEKGIFSSIDKEGGLILTTNNKDKIFYAAEIFEGL
jgi:BirA family biotin operon repressor/biotin-[acetyl-CoA-carboxylase] ligase